LKELLLPFQSHYKDRPMALGIITLYASAFITLSFYMKGVINQQWWRAIHYLTFGLFIGAMCHGLWIGTDTKRSVVYWSYLASAFGVLFLTFFRILAVRSQKPKKVVRLKTEAEAA